MEFKKLKWHDNLYTEHHDKRYKHFKNKIRISSEIYQLDFIIENFTEYYGDIENDFLLIVNGNIYSSNFFSYPTLIEAKNAAQYIFEETIYKEFFKKSKIEKRYDKLHKLLKVL